MSEKTEPCENILFFILLLFLIKSSNKNLINGASCKNVGLPDIISSHIHSSFYVLCFKK